MGQITSSLMSNHSTMIDSLGRERFLNKVPKYYIGAEVEAMFVRIRKQAAFS